MAPPLFFLLFVIVVAAIIAVGLFIAARTGLWVRETSTKGPIEDELPTHGRTARTDQHRFDREDADRPEHVKREDPTKSRYIGT